jgi:hypothetical protein
MEDGFPMPSQVMIDTAIAHLQQQGRPISVRTVRTLTGGSFRDIAPALRTWRGTQGLEQATLVTRGCAASPLSSTPTAQEPAQDLPQANLHPPVSDAAPDTPPAKRYTCARFPALAIGRHIRFRQGQYVTSDSEDQALIEANDWYGGLIQAVPE